MKHLFFSMVICIAATAGAQKVSGLYSGQLYNDSTKQNQNYELALSEYKGKLSGWAYVTFIANDTFYYGIRRIKGVQNGNIIVFQDDQFVANNFPESPAKGVKRTYTFTLTGIDTVQTMSGKWQTNSTKKYFAVPGSAQLQRSSDSSGSALISHLKELGWKGDYNETPVIAAVPKKERKPIQAKEATAGIQKTNPSTEQKVVQGSVIPFQQRTNQLLQTMAVSTDSLVLHFYDNGVVDGDVISVYVNGVQVLEHTKLTEQAVKKTISVKPIASGDVTLTLVAETLGSLPPNTGLLVVHDGTTKHQIRFSADLQTNATIVFKKN